MQVSGILISFLFLSFSLNLAPHHIWSTLSLPPTFVSVLYFDILEKSKNISCLYIGVYIDFYFCLMSSLIKYIRGQWSEVKTKFLTQVKLYKKNVFLIEIENLLLAWGGSQKVVAFCNNLLLQTKIFHSCKHGNKI